jgi:hypothetical protein
MVISPDSGMLHQDSPYVLFRCFVYWTSVQANTFWRF